VKIEMAAICDAATESGGKLNILGTFDVLNAPNFPFVLPGCSVVFRMRFNRVEDGEHQIRVNFVDVDGKAVIPPLESKIKVAVHPEMDSRVSNMILNLQGLRFPAAGTYSIDLAVDQRHETSLPLWVREAANPPLP